MMKYYQILYDYSNSDDLMFLRFNESELSFGRYDVHNTKAIATESIYCTIAEDQTEECDYIANNLVWLVISEKTKKIFERFNICKCQYIKVIDKATGKLVGYLVSCLESCDAIDEENSVGSYDFAGFSAIKYAVKEDKTRDLDFFQLEEIVSPYFISERLYKELKKNKVKGFDFSLIKTT